jgi:RNA methyltransferase, TrmH family
MIEGRQEIRMAIASGIEILELYLCPEFGADKEDVLAGEKFELPKDLFNKISLRENPDGYIALASPKIKSLEDIEISRDSLLIVLEGLEKPGNIGAIMRSADAVKADAVIVCDPKADIYSPNSIRSGLGTIFSNQVIVCSSAQALDWLKAKDINIYSALPAADKVYWEQDYTGPSAIVIGTEHEGLSEIWKIDTIPVKIPMSGKIDSLNASVSAAVILFEAARQRNFKPGIL